jgi:hypothetical protein
MTVRDQDNKLWADFAHTVRVIVASGIAQQQLAARAGQQRPIIRQFSISLLAASAAPGFALPVTEIPIDGGALGVLIDDRSVSGSIRVMLQLKGYATLQQCAGRDGWMSSDNGAIDCMVQFSQRGSAVCVFEDLPEIREGLRSCKVLSLGPLPDANEDPRQ